MGGLHSRTGSEVLIVFSGSRGEALLRPFSALRGFRAYRALHIWVSKGLGRLGFRLLIGLLEG